MSQEDGHRSDDNASQQERDVIEYLHRTPDFFERHPQVLAGLSNGVTGEAAVIPLAQRQLDVLRSRLKALEQRLQDIVETARENEGLGQRRHRGALNLTRVMSSEPLHALAQVVRTEFKLEWVTIRLAIDPASRDREGDGAAGYDALAERVAHGRSVCDDRLPSALLDHLFAEHAERIRSCAIVPVAVSDGSVIGVLALGASEPERFRPSMGTVYLDRLGELVGAAAERLRGHGGQ